MKLQINKDNTFLLEEEIQLQPFCDKDIILEDIRDVAALNIPIVIVYDKDTDSLVLDHPYAW
jgi:hypothetical protein